MANGKLSSAIALVGLVLLMGCASRTETSSARVMEVPAARVTPISVPGTRMFGASPVDLGAAGYVEQEYDVSGVANRYAFDDLMQNAAVIDAGYAYKTRMIVRRPTNPAKFNGTVVVEWYNVTLGQDIDFNWATSRDYLMREGYAHVSVSAQRVGVERLKTWSGARYGDLAVVAPETTPKDPLQAHDVLRWDLNDALSWDIFSQTVKALREPGTVDVLPGMKARRVIATGESQAGRRLTQYYNSIDPLHRLVDGMVLYDPGYNTWHLLRGDNTTKLISVGSEVHSDGRKPVPDGATTRRWEVAGTSHLSAWDMQYVDAMTSRDMGLKQRDGTAVATVQDLIPGCKHYPLWSAVPMHKVLNAAFDQVNRWAGGGLPASPGKALERSADGALLRHDENGRTFGGIQLAEYAYPSAFNLGYRNPGPLFCRNGGHHRFYSAAELKSMYPDPDAYVRGVVEATNANLTAGYILGFDAAESIEAARALVK